MKLNKLLQNSYRLFMVMMLSVVALPSAFNQLNAAAFPVLSLSGGPQYNNDWYPFDGRMVLAPSPETSSLTEVLVPVFIQNTDENKDNIYSFRIKLKYDSDIFEPVGIQSFHPSLNDPKFTKANPNAEAKFRTVGNDFQFTYDTYEDSKYSALTGFLPGRSKAMKIVGTSSKPLATTIDDQGAYKFYPFFYVKMKVKKRAAVGTPQFESYLMVDGDSVYFNDKLMTGAENYLNLAGKNWFDLTNSGLNKIGRGSIKLVITEKRPEIAFYREPLIGTGTPVAIRSVMGNSEFELVDPITVDYKRLTSTNNVFEYQTRELWIKNLINDSRLNDVIIDSDEPWLSVSIEDNDNYVMPKYISYIDRIETSSSLDGVALTIKCDPNMIKPEIGEVEGTYVGYLTVRSKDGVAQPVKLKVTFIVLRPAYEPHVDSKIVNPTHQGMRINVGRTDNSEVKSLVFGVAPRATNEVDTLMGERAALTLMNSFDARWVPVDATLKAKYPQGFVDALPDITRPDYNSRDIRSIDDTLQSIVYMCRFNTPKYPLFITWDPTDFPEGAILFLKDSATRGQKIALNMREGTVVPNTNLLSYTFTDASMNNFIIEYTLPKIINFVNEDGDPIIKKGWNLLSLPVRPSSASISNVYPNSMNKNAIIFFPSGWEQTERDLVPGQGFFIRYSNIIDSSFAGAQISTIAPENGDKVRIYKGWNLIGALSNPTSVKNISFVSRDNTNPIYSDASIKEYVKKYSYWAYRTNEGYYEVNQLLPGLGYFIKVGYIIDGEENDAKADSIEAYLKITHNLTKSFSNDVINTRDYIYNSSAAVTIRDNGQKSTSVYLSSDKNIDEVSFEMPPVIGDKFFDVRFANNAKLSNNEKSTINLTGVEYPVSISVRNADADLFFYDALTNELLGVIAKNSNSNLEVKSTNGNKINVVKSNVEFNAYPNPVTNTAKVTYTVPEAAMVTVKLFDALGNEVAELVNTYLNANNYSVDFDASNLSSGAYILKVTAGNYSAVRSVTVVK